MANVILVVLVLCVLVGETIGNRREDMIQDSVRRLLGVNPDVEPTHLQKKKTAMPPRYMMDLYEKYRSGQAPMQGNTVRSILPMRDTIGTVDLLMFNLTGINPSEQILQSKLYILKRRKPTRGKRKDVTNFRIKIGIIPQMSSHRYIDISLATEAPEWHSYDITDSVVHCRQSKRNGDQLLGLTLEFKKRKGMHRLSPFSRVIKKHSQPFVLIFSEDSFNQSHSLSRYNKKKPKEGIGDLLQTKDLRGFSSTQPPRYVTNFQGEKSANRNRRSIKETVSPLYIPAAQNFIKIFGTKIPSAIETSNMVKANRSIFSNSDMIPSTKLLYDILHFLNLTHINTSGEMFNLSSTIILNKYFLSEVFRTLNTTKRVMSSRQEFLKVLQSSADFFSYDKNVLIRTMHMSDKPHLDVLSEHQRSKRSVSRETYKETRGPDATANTFQELDTKLELKSNSSSVKQKPRHHRQRGRTRSSKRPRKRKLPLWWTRHDSRLHSQDHGSMCQRRSMVVDFTKLGWGEWVMSPKSFNAYYCTGGCSFPLIKNTNPSNHAALQSLVHALGLNSNVPAASCVPAATSPLTLLYFDGHGNLVLKKFPDMIVQKCACR